MTPPAAGRIWLDVPYADKDQAKTLGARWDSQARRWYAPRGGKPALARWLARPDLPELLPGEDRTYGAGLFVDLIPQTSWFTNVRSAVDGADWDRLRRMVYRRAGYRCEACGAAGDRERGIRMEAHERFTYDATTGVQRLVRLICLCEWCHTATHMGFAGVRGVQDEAIAHLITVTGMSPSEAEGHVTEAFIRWERRSMLAWSVDVSMIAAAGIRLRGQSAQPEQANLIIDADNQNAQNGPIGPGSGSGGRSAPPPSGAGDRAGEAADGILVMTTIAEFIPASDLAPAREISDAEKALAASYEKYADQVAEIEALRSGRR